MLFTDEEQSHSSLFDSVTSYSLYTHKIPTLSFFLLFSSFKNLYEQYFREAKVRVDKRKLLMDKWEGEQQALRRVSPYFFLIYRLQDFLGMKFISFFMLSKRFYVHFFSSSYFSLLYVLCCAQIPRIKPYLGIGCFQKSPMLH